VRGFAWRLFPTCAGTSRDKHNLGREKAEISKPGTGKSRER
jgi:hypothetical protein